MAAVAVVAAAESVWVVLAIAALALSVIALFNDHRSRPIGALIGMLCALALLHLPGFWFFGAPSLVTAIAVVPVIASAFERSSKLVRQRTLIALAASIGFVLVGAVGAGVTALEARSATNRAVDSTRTALELIRDGNRDEAVRTLFDSRQDFMESRDALTAPWSLPASILPVIGLNLNAVQTAVSSGLSVVEAAQIAVSSAPYGDLRLVDGQIDLDLVSAMQEPVSDLQRSLESATSDLASVDSGWLVAQISEPLDTFDGEIAQMQGTVDIAAAGLGALPTLLGAGGEANYLVQFTNTAETRALGGFMGSWGLLRATNGRILLDGTDSVGTLKEKLTAGFPYAAPPDFRERYARFRPDMFAQNWTASPDFVDNAFVSTQLFEQAEKTRIDGVMMIDPEGVAALLALTGPVRVPGLAEPLDSKNVVAYLTLGQYRQFEGQVVARRDGLEAVAKAVFDALGKTSLPGYQALAELLGPTIQGGHILFTTKDATTNSFLDQISMTGRFPRVDGDLLSLRSANANPNKIDSFLQRSMNAEIAVDPATGETSTQVTITLTNTAPASGLPTYVIGNDRGDPLGTNAMYLSLYSPLTIDRAELAGKALRMEIQTEFAINVYSATVTVPPGSTVTLQIWLRGTIPMANGDYSLTIPAQPMINDDKATITIRSTNAAQPFTQAGGFSSAVTTTNRNTVTVTGALSRTWTGQAKLGD